MGQIFERLGAGALLVLVVGFGISAQPADAQRAPTNTPNEKNAAPLPASDVVAAARELLRASGVAAQFEAVMPAMIKQMADLFVRQQPAHENAIREVFQTAQGRMLDRKGELIEQIAQLYARKFTSNEIRELTQFYSAGIGKKFIDNQAGIATEAMQLGQSWGERIGREIDVEMRQELRKKGVPI